MRTGTSLLDFLEAVVNFLDFAFGAILDIDQFGAGPVGGGEKLVQLNLKREHPLALRSLDEEQEDKGGDGDKFADRSVGSCPADEGYTDCPRCEDAE